MINLSNALQNTTGKNSKTKKRQMIEDFAANYVSPANFKLFSGIITFNIAIGITKQTLLKNIDKF
jgi:hypothetical protein